MGDDTDGGRLAAAPSGIERRRSRLVAAGVCFIGSLAVAVSVLAWNDLRVRRDAGERHLVAVADGIARELGMTLQNFGRAFGGVAADLEALERGVPSATVDALRRQAVDGVLERHPALVDLRLVESLPANAAAHPPGPDALRVGTPRRLGPGGAWVLPLVRAMPAAADGSPRWLVGSLRVAALQANVAGHDLGARGATTVVHSDDGLLVTGSDAAAVAGAGSVASPPLEDFRGTRRGALETRGDAGERRFVGFATVAGYPLVVTASSTGRHVLGGWYAFVATLSAGCMLLALTWLGGLWMLRASAREERAMRHTLARSADALTDLRARVREAETQYRFLYERFPLPACVFDRETLAILEVNEAALAQYGYSRDEFLALDPAELLAEGSIDEIRDTIGLEREVRGERLWKHRRRDGSLLQVAIFANTLVFLGRPARLVLALDVTARERAEAERARSEARFQMVSRATSDAIWDLDVESGALWWNEGFRAHSGWEWQDVAATLAQWVALIHPDDRARVQAGFDAAVAGGAEDWSASYRLARADGSHAHVEDRGLILRDAGGRVVRAVGGMRDVTRQHRDEADLRLLRRAVEATGNGIVILDAQQEGQPLVYVNPAFERISGHTASEAVGRGPEFLLGDPDDPTLHADMARALAEARDVRVQARSTRRDGTGFWSELRVTPVRDGADRLTHFVAIVNDISDRKRVEEALAHRATHDALTGLPNRELLEAKLDEALRGEYDGMRAVAFLDLDDFKLINDSLGHAVGDEVLVTTARRLSSALGDGDMVARFGGDEFVLVLRGRDEPALAARIASVLDVLAPPVETHGAVLQVTSSVGWSRHPGDGDDAQALLRRADQAMYQAKRRGRNCVVAHRSEFDAGASHRLALVLQLREALQRGEFMLVFQPQFDRDNRPVGLEALLRWRHPTRGLLAPVHFIGACEDSGLIVPIGAWVLREAARHHHLLAAHGWGRLRIAVNVSAAQFQQGLASDVAAVLRDHALPRDVLELELTESVVMANPETAIRCMQEISDLGVQIAIDDFGTGYSSLAYLKRLPLHRLKLDRSFVRDLGRDPDDEAICAAIIRLAQSLDLQTTAEGVETETQWKWLRDRGCDEMQGYLLGHPAPFEETLARLGSAWRAG